MIFPRFGATLVLLLFALSRIPVLISFTDTTLPASHFIQSQSNDLNIILMIGDGMGFEHVKLGRWVEAGKDGNLTMEQGRLNWSVTTQSSNAEITDSAASATALATGVKTNNNMLAVNPLSQPLETILEIAQSTGKATGLVSTCTINHATPAAFMTHVNSRTMYTEITRQIVEEAKVDVLLGGGKGDFSSSQISAMQNDGYTFVENRTKLAEVTSGKLLGLFSSSHMPYEQDRNYATTPSIAEMTNKSLELLSQDLDGFFLMVEGGRIDHGSHDNDKVDTVLDTIAFDKAVEVALDFVSTHSNTILMITADHECGGLSILGENLNSTLPTKENSEEDNRYLRIDRVNNITVTWSTTYHTSSNVPLYCYGDFFESLPDFFVIDNTDIFYIMQQYYLENTITTTDLIRAPTIVPHDDIEYDVGATGNSITWNPADNNPMDYEIRGDGELLKTGDWNHTFENISLTVDGLGIGVYMYELTVLDAFMNSATDQVVVTVIDIIPPVIEAPADFEFENDTIGNQIQFNCSDYALHYYWFYDNNSLVQQDIIDGPIISLTFDLDALIPGSHNLTLVVQDQAENQAKTTVWVTVVEVSATTTTATATTTTTTMATTTMTTTITSANGSIADGSLEIITMIIIAVIGAAVIVIMLVIIVRRRSGV